VEPDYDDPKVEASWIEEQREEVLSYLSAEHVGIESLPADPAWHIPPYVAIWEVPSVRAPKGVGWWAISGDVPTDYISAAGISDARSAMSAFADRWVRAAESMRAGTAPSDFTIGSPAEWPQLAPLLTSRATLLADWASDEEIWAE
jgi:hypothetical protein